MKKLFKLGCFGFIGLIALGVIIGALADTETTENATEEKANTSTSETTESEPANTEPKEEAKEEPKEDGTISLEEFNSIENGMTYDQVVEIIGGEGVVQSEVGGEGEQFHTIMYSWDGETGFGANASVTFQGGVVESKAQFGLDF